MQKPTTTEFFIFITFFLFGAILRNIKIEILVPLPQLYDKKEKKIPQMSVT